MTTKTKTQTKTKRSIDPHLVDMPELFGDLIRERSLYSVLQSIADACRSRARSYGTKSLDTRTRSTQTLLQGEEAFFLQAAQDVESAVTFLKSEWGDEAPICADGDYTRWMNGAREAGRRSFLDQIEKITELFDSPDVSPESRSKAVAALAEELKETTWTSRETGRADFQMGENIHKLALGIDDPKLSVEERQEILVFLKKWMNPRPLHP